MFYIRVIYNNGQVEQLAFGNDEALCRAEANMIIEGLVQGAESCTGRTSDGLFCRFQRNDQVASVGVVAREDKP